MLQNAEDIHEGIQVSKCRDEAALSGAQRHYLRKTNQWGTCYRFGTLIPSLLPVVSYHISANRWIVFVLRQVRLGDLKETCVANGPILCVSMHGHLLYKDNNQAFLKKGNKFYFSYLYSSVEAEDVTVLRVSFFLRYLSF